MTRAESIRSIVGHAVSAALMLWLAASAAAQLGIQPLQRLRRLDLLGLVPIWTFFAPNPATGDLYLVYRDRSEGVGRWTEVRVRSPRRSALVTLWNPDRRAAKALFDVGAELDSISRTSQNKGAVQLSVPYLTLLEFTCSQPHVADAKATQFMLLSDHGLEKGSDPVPLFLSDWHTI
jgi:hypothetical protein